MHNEASNIQDRSGQKILLGLLTLVACAVWGSVYVRAIGGWQQSEGPERATDSLRAEQAPPPEAALRYRGTVRDIFRPPTANPIDSVSGAAPEEARRNNPSQLPLRHVLVGIMDGTALLRSPRGQMMIAGEGDTLWRRRVYAIQPDRVIFSMDAGPSDTLRLQKQMDQRNWFN